MYLNASNFSTYSINESKLTWPEVVKNRAMNFIKHLQKN